MKKQKLTLSQLKVKSFTTGAVKGGILPTGETLVAPCVSAGRFDCGGGPTNNGCNQGTLDLIQCGTTTVFTPSGESCPECAATIFTCPPTADFDCALF